LITVAFVRPADVALLDIYAALALGTALVWIARLPSLQA
jgi:hypothetical protein